VLEAIRLVTISAHSLRAYNPATVWLLNRSDKRTLDRTTSDLLERIQRLEREHAELRAERQLHIFAAQIVGAAQVAPVIGGAVEKFAQAMRAPLQRGRAGGLARARSRGAIWTAPSCRSPQNSKRGSLNTSATLWEVERAPRKLRVPRMAPFNQMSRLLIALFVVQFFFGLKDARAESAAEVIDSPDGALRAEIISVNENESRVEIRKSNGKLLCTKDYSSRDAEHGYGVDVGQWTPDSQFFVYDTASSGGHMPYLAPTFFYSRQTNRVRDIEEFTNRAVLAGETPPFKIVAPHSVVVRSSPDEYSRGKGYDIDRTLFVTVNLKTGAASPSPHFARNPPYSSAIPLRATILAAVKATA
jgi:hypothetical protein